MGRRREIAKGDAIKKGAGISVKSKHTSIPSTLIISTIELEKVFVGSTP